MPDPNPLPVLVSWSSGKDAAWALHTLRSQPDAYDVRGIFTTVNPTLGRVAVQATPLSVLRLQARRLKLPVYEIPLPSPCPNGAYEGAMRVFLDRVRGLPADRGATTLAFGDLFLDDIREYRQAQFQGSGFRPIFPIWGEPTAALAERMVAAGLCAIVTVVNTDRLDARFAGRWFDRDFLADLPSGVDPLGENGEFHTCVLDGPMFGTPIRARPGRPVPRPPGGTCVYADLEPIVSH